jgi:hypothetical protein
MSLQDVSDETFHDHPVFKACENVQTVALVGDVHDPSPYRPSQAAYSTGMWGLHGRAARGVSGLSWASVSLAATDACARLALFHSVQPWRHWRPWTPRFTLSRDSSWQVHQVFRYDAFPVPCSVQCQLRRDCHSASASDRGPCVLVTARLTQPQDTRHE